MTNNELIERECPMCGAINVMLINDNEVEGYDKWLFGDALIQEALPDFNPMEREFVKTGYCPECQRELFSSDYSSSRIVLEFP